MTHEVEHLIRWIVQNAEREPGPSDPVSLRYRAFVVNAKGLCDELIRLSFCTVEEMTTITDNEADKEPIK